jgi:hypothetical protein
MDYVIVIENAFGVVPTAELEDADRTTVASAKPPGPRLSPGLQVPPAHIENEFVIKSPFGRIDGFVLKRSESFPVPTFVMQTYCV